MTQTLDQLERLGLRARAAARKMAAVLPAAKDEMLDRLANRLIEEAPAIVAANEADYAEAAAGGLNSALLDRLKLTPDRIAGIAQDVRGVRGLPDPIGEIIDSHTRPDGLHLTRQRVPLGVIAAIYESRPNVTVDISVLCLKAGNAVILRGGKEAIRSNQALAAIVAACCREAGLPDGAVQLIESTDRELVGRLLKMRDTIDLLIPRGGSGLIQFVAENATMPVVTGGIGVCHTYVDQSADLETARAVAHNAKVRRPTICNALDTLLVHRDVAARFLPRIGRSWAEAGVEMRCDPAALEILREALGAEAADLVRPAGPDDFGYEFLAPIAAIKVVDSLDAAIDHIDRFGSGHSEAIVTESYSASQRFLTEVDAAAVYVNASTQFTDGAQFGLGAEVGISTQRLHARGPMGLRELTSYKWVIRGSGQTRP
ncbi:MAG TPA: glutamate-5-semialdehyde dehydrogenase [Dehalococcoidia bacterium]|nr:glutamate-5-semialdehyde dehydrogenase [Dehalococcoidia bacterium]